MYISRRTFIQISAASVAALALGGASGCASVSGKGTGSSSKTVFKEFVGTSSDYANIDNWMFYPTSHEHEADVLWFYPTSYKDAAGTQIGTIADTGMRNAAQTAYKAMGSVFEGVADVYVPYYRQVNGSFFSKMSAEEIEAEGWKEPRTDLYGALDYYFQNVNKGRPFILAGHSQGSSMLDIIMREYFKINGDLLDRLVAVYMLGCSLTQGLLDENALLKAATGADDTGVIVSWNTEGAGNSACGATLIVREGAICINPLNWKTDNTHAGMELNKGSWLPDASGAYSLQPGIADAAIDLKRGAVVCATVPSALYASDASLSPLFGPDSYHSYDYGFYYANIRENARLRVEKWLSGN